MRRGRHGPGRACSVLNLFNELELSYVWSVRCREGLSQGDLLAYGGELVIRNGVRPVLVESAMPDDLPYGLMDIVGQVRAWPLGEVAIGRRVQRRRVRGGPHRRRPARREFAKQRLGDRPPTRRARQQSSGRHDRNEPESLDRQIGAYAITMNATTLNNGNGRAADAAEHEFQRVKASLHEQLVESFDLSKITRVNRRQLADEVRSMAESAFGSRRDIPTGVDRNRLMDELLDEIFGLGPLERLMQDPTITDILVNDP